MSLSVAFCKVLNKLFPTPTGSIYNEVDYANVSLDYMRGKEYLSPFSVMGSVEKLLKDKIVLDIGCGLGGKTVYFAEQGAKYVIGVDKTESYTKDTTTFANSKCLGDTTTFITAEYSNMPIQSNAVDIIIMSGLLEHLDEPIGVLNECYRILKKGGHLLIDFRPYHHPYGAYLSDAIKIPWVHKLFDEQTLIQTYTDLVQQYPDAERRITDRICKHNGDEAYLSFINKMTLERFDRIMAVTSFQVMHLKYVPLRAYLKTMAMLPVFQEYFVKNVVCVLEKASTKTSLSFHDQHE